MRDSESGVGVGAVIERNRLGWEEGSDEYQATHGQRLEDTALAWGVWRIPEADLGVLGPVGGLRILELGCGAAQWSVALAEQGARAVGIDLSARQLAHAREAVERAGVEVPLVLGNGERLPFVPASFDLVFCDHGAFTFARPEALVAEASRVLSPGGHLAFCMSTPIRDLCWDPGAERTGERLVGDYFGLHRLEDDESVTFQLEYGAWIRLFRRHGLAVEDLVELRAPDGAETTYEGFAEPAWARRWPAEHIWKLRREAGPDAHAPRR